MPHGDAFLMSGQSSCVLIDEEKSTEGSLAPTVHIPGGVMSVATAIALKAKWPCVCARRYPLDVRKRTQTAAGVDAWFPMLARESDRVT